MDFFAQQEASRRRLHRLVPLTGLALLVLVIAHYAAVVSTQRFAFAFRDTSQPGARARRAPLWWNPHLFFGTATGTLAITSFLAFRRWRQLRADANLVALLAGGRPLSAEGVSPEERRLLNTVEEMAIAAGLPAPAVFVLDDEPGINAFAAGLSCDHATLAFTRGALTRLSRAELQAMAAHEIGHLAHGDVSLNTRLFALFDGLQFVRHLWCAILRGLRRFSLRRFGNEHQKATMMAVGVAILTLAMVNPPMLVQITGTILVTFVLLGLLGLLSANLTGLLRSAIGFEREFLADAAAVQFTRDRTGLAGAMDKIADSALGASLQCHKAEVLGHFFFAEGFSSILQIWPTHPPLKKRRQQIDPENHSRAARLALVAVRSEADDLLLRVTMRTAAAAAGTPAPVDAAIHAPSPPPDLPPILRETASDPERATFLALALLLASAPERRTAQLATLNSHLRETVTELELLTRSLETGARLRLLEQAIAALAALLPAARRRLVATAGPLLNPESHGQDFDGPAKAQLSALVAPPAIPAGEITSIPLVQTEFALVLSAFAHRVAATPVDAVRLFQTAAERLPQAIGPIALLPIDSCGDDDRANATATLRHATPPIRDHLITAAAHLLERHCLPLSAATADAYTELVESLGPTN